MSIFTKIRDAFRPVQHVVEQAGHEFDPQHIADLFKEAIEKPIRSKLPNHLSLGQVKEIVEIAKPDAIDVDVFVGFGVEIGVELELEFDMGITIEDPIHKIGALVSLVENPPETVHQLCDRLWSVAPAEVRVYQRLQAVVGEQAQIRWAGDGVMERATQYITDRGWMEKKLRP